MRRALIATLAGCLALAAAPALAAEDIKITSDTFGGLQARAIGPATMSGRIAAHRRRRRPIR